MKVGGISEYNDSANINKRASSALRNYELNSFDISLPAFGKPLSISLNTAKIVREFHASMIASIQKVLVPPPIEH